MPLPKTQLSSDANTHSLSLNQIGTPENTHNRGKVHYTAGLQFNKQDMHLPIYNMLFFVSRYVVKQLNPNM